MSGQPDKQLEEERVKSNTKIIVFISAVVLGLIVLALVGFVLWFVLGITATL